MVDLVIAPDGEIPAGNFDNAQHFDATNGVPVATGIGTFNAYVKVDPATGLVVTNVGGFTWDTAGSLLAYTTENANDALTFALPDYVTTATLGDVSSGPQILTDSIFIEGTDDIEVGLELSAEPVIAASLDAEGTATVTYQWQQADDASGTNTTAISGETDLALILPASVSGKHVRILATATDNQGSDTLASDWYSVVEDYSPNWVNVNGFDIEMPALSGTISSFVMYLAVRGNDLVGGDYIWFVDNNENSIRWTYSGTYTGLRPKSYMGGQFFADSPFNYGMAVDDEIHLMITGENDGSTTTLKFGARHQRSGVFFDDRLSQLREDTISEAGISLNDLGTPTKVHTLFGPNIDVARAFMATNVDAVPDIHTDEGQAYFLPALSDEMAAPSLARDLVGAANVRFDLYGTAADYNAGTANGYETLTVSGTATDA